MSGLLPSVVPSQLTWARSTLEGWKIRTCSHLLCSARFKYSTKVNATSEMYTLSVCHAVI